MTTEIKRHTRTAQADLGGIATLDGSFKGSFAYTERGLKLGQIALRITNRFISVPAILAAAAAAAAAGCSASNKVQSPTRAPPRLQ